MTKELPIACNLSPDAAADRLNTLEQLAQDALIGASRTPTAIELRFRAGERNEQRLLEFIEAERQCCPFLDFELTRGRELRLRIVGPGEAKPVLDALLGAAAP
jgi:hypothetical protein